MRYGPTRPRGVFQAIPGARIHVVGSDARAETRHDGTFLLPLQPGRYLVAVAHAGFAQQLIGVTVPADSGRRLAAWLSPQQQQKLSKS